MDLQSIRQQASEIARQTGAALLKLYEQPHEEKTKANINDVVTEGDLAAEAVIVPALRAHFPDDGIVSEEGGGTHGQPKSGCSWYIDPIDGTVNFASNLPYFSVSIALADADMNPLVGVVYNPVYDELFSAARGFGATLNDKPIYVSSTPTLARSVLASGFPSNRATEPDNNLPEWTRILMNCRDLRRFGSAALELCFVASGRLDGYWEQRLHAWDCLAGLLCVEEAGGRVSDYKGVPGAHVYNGDQIIASNGLIHDEIVAALGK